MNKIHATARVQITVEVDAANWNPTISMQELHDVAAKEGVNTLRNILAGKARIIGEPKVILVCGEVNY